MTQLDESAGKFASTGEPAERLGKSGARRSLRLPGGTTVVVTPVFDSYWRFAHLRQEAFMSRVSGGVPPWTDDAVIAAHRFTNVYRASDRVSQYLIRNVIYTGSQDADEVFFRTMLFKLFNKIETWEHLVAEVGPLSSRSFRMDRVERVLDGLMSDGATVYSAAYIMPSPAFGEQRKHANHLRLLAHMMKDGAVSKVTRARSLAGVFETLRGYPSLGDFLAFQLTIDLNYGPIVDFSEMDFVVAGPGARDGIKKCFADTGGLSEHEIIRAMAEMAPAEFERQHLPFRDLWGRPLQLIDCQNLFCEVDKYARVVHPEFSGASGRTRIKQRFVPAARPVPQWYPPKWNIHPPVDIAIEVRDAPRGRPKQTSLFTGLT
ncbi:MAG TPA: nucleotide kinase domain-containing protein [Polyangiaceae bacterium]|jgi:hypothetical protein|nr:nucleotide kinase domain-containing protein [Polyangiaceae bacterium]